MLSRTILRAAYRLINDDDRTSERWFAYCSDHTKGVVEMTALLCGFNMADLHETLTMIRQYGDSE